jgi:putative membrane protein
MKINAKFHTLGLAVALAFGGVTVATAATAAPDAPAHSKSSVTKKDSDFLKKLAETNIAEIETGKLAQSKSKDEKVLNFSKHMIEDHTAGLNDVKKLADAKGVALPSEPNKAHKEAAAKLSKLEGEKFDKAYLTDAGLKDHKAAKALTTKVATTADDSELKALAEKMSATITKHIEMVEEVVRK